MNNLVTKLSILLCGGYLEGNRVPWYLFYAQMYLKNLLKIFSHWLDHE